MWVARILVNERASRSSRSRSVNLTKTSELSDPLRSVGRASARMGARSARSVVSAIEADCFGGEAT